MRAACLALAAAVAAAAAACGGTGGGGPLADAQSKMEAKATARGIVTAAWGHVVQRCDVVLDFDRRRAGMTCDQPAGATGGEAAPIEMRMIGDTTYVRPSHDGKWFATDEGGDQLSQVDPRTLLEQLQKDARDVSVVGKDDVRGVATTHYHLETGDGGPADVWVDGDGLVRRMQTVDSAGADETQLDLEFLEFGAEVDIEPPPPDEVDDENVGTATVSLQPCDKEPKPIGYGAFLDAVARSRWADVSGAGGAYSCDGSALRLKIAAGVECSLHLQPVAGDAVERPRDGVLAIENASCTVADAADEPRVESLLRAAASG